MSSCCWKCGAPLSDRVAIDGKVPFRASCDSCRADLHCCRNCRHYMVGKPNDCMVPDTEPVYDRSRSNLCESFSMLGKKVAASGSKEEIERRLFE